jgi:iron(III) transport system substrate-binding protein
MNISRLFAHALILSLVVLALAGCGANNNAGDPAQTAELAPTESLDPGALVIYSGRSESLVQPLIDQFVEQTGIDVDVRYAGTAELAATLLEEGQNSPADIFYAQDPGGLGAVQQAGLLAPLPDDLLAQLPARFVADDGTWLGVSGRARVLVYNTDNLSEADLPDDLSGLTDPQWDGRIGWAPSNGSFQAMVTAMRHIWGDEQTRAWLEGMQANNPVVFENNTAIVEAVGSGEIDLGLVNHYYLFRFLAEQGESFPARNYFLPSGGPGSLLMVSGAGILKTAANADNARAFIEFLLSETAQQYFADETYEYPVIDGISIAPLLPPLADLDAQAAEISLADMADLAGTTRMLSDLSILP